jgi:hypothetical protein
MRERVGEKSSTIAAASGLTAVEIESLLADAQLAPAPPRQECVSSTLSCTLLVCPAAVEPWPV